jgi:hypothetical protein
MKNDSEGVVIKMETLATLRSCSEDKQVYAIPMQARSLAAEAAPNAQQHPQLLWSRMSLMTWQEVAG